MPTPDTTPRRNLVTGIRLAVTIVLGGIGAAAGFTHTHDWAVHNGQAGWLAWADAVVIEGMAIVAGFELHRDHRTGTDRRRITFPAVVLVAGIVIQMAAQVALAPRTPAGWLLAAMPALGFLVVVKLLMRRAPHDTDQPPPPAESAPASAATASRPAHVPAETKGSTLAKLPAGVRANLTRATETAHQAGRPVTADDITAAVNLPDALLTTLVDELNTSVNHHPATT
ncbi:DUF2637 domain-containing protein [Amycolatopsis sp. K13G38]|uniref:DUF2637 domain-containing protein n=1 Tax=Amycolatopsis acididurans TaxID=2724524 RepID=A0ABX1J0K6_9PSEU|nr:DUF2637 domain-containing protein [Amycolatopsis acididurans]NKQ53313.1 DUF2637 domain-containing protein [Amycolatopsis acididurans]